VAALVVQSVRATDLVARLGGDEFVVLMSDTEETQARVLMDRVTDAIAADVRSRWSVGVTVGAMTFTEPPDDLDCALREADELMYRGKAAGRGHLVQASWPAAGTGC
jgi:diguanylate cyclase (GGDEF)-like protein